MQGGPARFPAGGKLGSQGRPVAFAPGVAGGTGRSEWRFFESMPAVRVDAMEIRYECLAPTCCRPKRHVSSTGSTELEAFLAALGRADLARAARTAKRAADRERGLDNFQGQLPNSVLQPPKLHVEPLLIDLGTIHPGQERRSELALHNDGQRLLSGTASIDDHPWLTLGDGPGQQRRVFQLADRLVLPVRVLGSSVRAYRKSQQAGIQQESNGGTATVTMRITVLVQPFPEGVLAGALGPRELASKAHDAPKEAAALIESGAAARWYQANGWDYPVPGPAATGKAAVQQLFEALGLVKPPQVELSDDAIHLHGLPGEKVEYSLAVITQENRAAIAHGTSDRPWLVVGPTIFRGRSAFMPLTIAAVPGQVGDTVGAVISAIANGDQRFAVPVTLTVGPAPAAGPRPPRQLAVGPVPLAPVALVPAVQPTPSVPTPTAAPAAAPPRPQVDAVGHEPHRAVRQIRVHSAGGPASGADVGAHRAARPPDVAAQRDARRFVGVDPLVFRARSDRAVRRRRVRRDRRREQAAANVAVEDRADQPAPTRRRLRGQRFGQEDHVRRAVADRGDRHARRRGAGRGEDLAGGVGRLERHDSERAHASRPGGRVSRRRRAVHVAGAGGGVDGRDQAGHVPVGDGEGRRGRPDLQGFQAQGQAVTPSTHRPQRRPPAPPLLHDGLE
jgi:hypothetical protein